MIGITGSNGKTSTKDILVFALKRKYVTQKTHGNMNNEIGCTADAAGAQRCDAGGDRGDGHGEPL